MPFKEFFEHLVEHVIMEVKIIMLTEYIASFGLNNILGVYGAVHNSTHRHQK